ncbi:hypothetical protein Tco_0465983 [Tanacetum coccineum]
MDYQLASDKKQHLAFACEVISKWKAGFKDDMDARSDVYVLSNNCRKCSDDSDGYYWEYTLAKGNVLGMEIVRNQGGNTMRVSQSRFYNGKLVQTLLKGHSILSLEGSLSGDCDVGKNGKWSCIYMVRSQEYQMVCTRLDIGSADVGMLDKFDNGLQTDVHKLAREEQTNPQGSARTTSAVDLEEFCEKHYEKLLPIMADKYEYEQRKKEKLEAVKARLEFGEVRKKTTRAQESAYSESRTMSPRRQRRSRSPRHNPSIFTRLRRERSRSPRHEYKDKERKEGTMFKRLGSRGRSTSVYSDNRQESSKYTKGHSESEDSEGGHWKSKSRRKKSSVEDDDLSQPWVCAETDPFTSRIRHFDFPKTRMPSHVKTYKGSEDLEDHLKIFQAAAKMERWVMPTWCHMFNSTLTGNAQKKCIRDPIVLHNIKQRDGESTEDFIQRYKSESGNVKGAPECMRISGFMHGITNPELIKRFHEKIPKTVDEMMQVATSFLQG